MCDNPNCKCDDEAGTDDCIKKGRDGRNGRDGKDGQPGKRGPKGEKGDKGECVIHNCRRRRSFDEFSDNECDEIVCKKYALDFTGNCKESKAVYKIANINLVTYGFRASCTNVDCQPLPLCIKSNRHKNGLGCDSNDAHFIQIDLGDYIRVKDLRCGAPKIKIGEIQKYERIYIFGSNTLGSLGKELYSYINNDECSCSHEVIIPSFNSDNLTKTGDLYLYGVLPFRYISVSACNGSVILNSITLFLKDCC